MAYEFELLAWAGQSRGRRSAGKFKDQPLIDLWCWRVYAQSVAVLRQPACGKDRESMRKRLRKFIGSVTMVLFVTFYALAAMVLTQAQPVQHAAWYIQTLVYAALGMAWILPMMPLIKWMERPDEP